MKFREVSFNAAKIGSANIEESKVGEIDPASLCSLAIALWGYQTSLIIVALPIIFILEGRRIIQQRWTLSVSDLKEAGKLCLALLAILFVIIVTVKKSVFIYTLLQWLPVAGLPLLIAQTYGLGTSELVYQQLLSPHPYQNHHQPTKHNRINLHTLYFGVCIVAASATDSDHAIFYIGATILTALLLWPLRPKRTTPILWLLLFCLSAGLGFAGHRQLAQAQQQLEAQMIAMIGNIASGAVNPDGTATYMGSVGRLKLSNKIAFRVSANATTNKTTNLEADSQTTFPLLLQEATYNQYELSTWRAENSLFSDVPPGEDDGHWILGPASEQDTTITISTDLERGDGILTLPRGTANIIQLPVEEMQRNQYGAVQVNAKGNTAYQVQFQPATRTTDARPTAADLQIPEADRAAVDQVLTQLSINNSTNSTLSNKSKQEIIAQIAAYFQDFQYSLDLLQPEIDTTAVSDFLLNTKAGHCEYFASATALLLRGVGIPTRYAVGYSAHEYSPLERQYVVRSRDAHAWTLFYLDNRWQILDTTPSDWAAQEQAATSPLQVVPDFFAFIGFQFSYWVRQLGELGLREVLIIVIPLFCYLLWRSIQVFQGQRKNTSEEAQNGASSQFLPAGLDSELYQVEALLKEQGLERSHSESLMQWCDRMQTHLPKAQYHRLSTILSLHYRYRFDPTGLNLTEREQLQQLSQQWIKQQTLTQETQKV